MKQLLTPLGIGQFALSCLAIDGIWASGGVYGPGDDGFFGKVTGPVALICTAGLVLFLAYSAVKFFSRRVRFYLVILVVDCLVAPWFSYRLSPGWWCDHLFPGTWEQPDHRLLVLDVDRWFGAAALLILTVVDALPSSRRAWGQREPAPT